MVQTTPIIKKEDNKMYFVKITSVATETNKNFAGETHTYLYGKEETLIETQGSKSLQVRFTPYFARCYGYKRKCDAVRSMKRHQQFFEVDSLNWLNTAEVVEISV